MHNLWTLDKEAAVKDVWSVLRQKESDLMRVHAEVEALRFVIPLLADGSESPDGTDLFSASSDQGNKWPLELRVVSSQ
jgi:hypothetical protein